MVCYLCDQPIDLESPETDGAHDSCLQRDPNEPDDPDWEYDEGLR